MSLFLIWIPHNPGGFTSPALEEIPIEVSKHKVKYYLLTPNDSVLMYTKDQETKELKNNGTDPEH